MRSSRRTISSLSVTIILATTALVGCGEDDSAAAQVCDDRAALSSAVQTVVDDLGAGNLGDAKEHLAQVRTAFDDLAASIDALAAEEKEDLQPQVEQIKADLEAAGGTGSLTELQTSWTIITRGVAGLIADVADDLDCDE